MIESVTRSPTMAAAAGFLRWWGSELADTVRALNPRSKPNGPAVRILIEPDCVAVEQRQGDSAERFVEARSFDSFDAGAFAELGALIAGTRPRLVLQPPDIFTTSLALPLAVRSRLDAAVALQIAEIAPLRPELLVWTIVERETRDERLHVRIAMAKRARIDTIVERFVEHDLPVPIICAADGDEGTPFPQARSQGWAGVDFGRHGFALLSAMLLATIPLTTLAASAVLSVRAGWRAAALEQPVRDIRSAERTAKRMEERRHLLAPLYRQPAAATILNALAKSLPPGDWLRSIQRKADGALTLTVVTRDEAALDKALRASALMSGARVSDRTSGKDEIVDMTYVTDAP